MRKNINITPIVETQIKEYAKKMKVSQSQFIETACMMMIKMFDASKKLVEEISKDEVFKKQMSMFDLDK